MIGHPPETLGQLQLLLDEYHGLPKEKLRRRHSILNEIVALSSGFAGRKVSTRSRGKAFDAALLLSQQATLRFLQESAKIERTGTQLTAPAAGGGTVGIKGKNVYERAMAPGSRAAGQEAWGAIAGDLEDDLAGQGTDAEKAYALRLVLKRLGPQGITGLGLRVQHYLTDDEQDEHRIAIDDQGRILTSTGLLDTRGVNGEPKGQAMFASNPNSVMVVYLYDKDSQQQINHSSLLGGVPVQCAGTIGGRGGMITDITTASGHYQPDLIDIYNCVQMLLGMGYVRRRLEHVTFFDGASQYRMPMELFLNTNGNPPNRIDFAGQDFDHITGRFNYRDKTAASRRGCMDAFGRGINA
jgi:hypothetical protein